MKKSFWDKVLMFLYVLITLAFGICMALQSFGVDLLGGMFAGIERGAGRFLTVLVGLGLGAIVVLLSAYMVMALFCKGKKRVPASFVSVNSDDGAQVHMSLAALSQMARQAIGRVPEAKELKVSVTSEDNEVSVKVELILKASAHVPTVTKNMQKSIRNSLETNCGVTVRDVEIVVSALSGSDIKPAWKKPRWMAGSGAGRKETGRVEAVAAQEAAAPVPEVPEPAPSDVDDASAQAEGPFAPVEAEDALDGAPGSALYDDDAWKDGLAPLEDGPEPPAPDEDAADGDVPEEDAHVYGFGDGDEDGVPDGAEGEVDSGAGDGLFATPGLPDDGLAGDGLPDAGAWMDEDEEAEDEEKGQI